MGYFGECYCTIASASGAACFAVKRIRDPGRLYPGHGLSHTHSALHRYLKACCLCRATGTTWWRGDAHPWLAYQQISPLTPRLATLKSMFFSILNHPHNTQHTTHNKQTTSEPCRRPLVARRRPRVGEEEALRTVFGMVGWEVRERGNAVH